MKSSCDRKSDSIFAIGDLEKPQFSALHEFVCNCGGGGLKLGSDEKSDAISEICEPENSREEKIMIVDEKSCIVNFKCDNGCFPTFPPSLFKNKADIETSIVSH